MFKRRAEPMGNGGNFLKVEDGQSVVGVFRGEPFEFYQAWPRGGEKQVSTEPFAGGKLRFKINLVVKEGDKFVAKVWEFGVRINNQLAEIAEEYDLSTTKVKISRKGSDKNTAWTILPITKEPLNKKQLAEIDAVELNILGEAAPVSESTEAGEADEKF